MDYKVRKAKEKDLEAIHQLVRELAIYENAEHEFVADISTYEENFKAGVFEAIVVEAGDEVVGMALYYLTFSTWKGRMMYLEDFVVRASHRGKGIGQLVFDAFKEESVRQNCQLAKWQVLDWNEPAIKFYEKNNATIEKEWWNGKIFFEGNG